MSQRFSLNLIQIKRKTLYVVIKAADEVTDKTTAINQMWQTDFTYFKIIGWGWYYLSTILDDDSRYIIAWKLCTNMRAEDVTNTIELALQASGCDQAVVRHKPRLLSERAIEAPLVRAQWRAVPATSLAIWPNGWRVRRCIMSTVRHSTRKLRARSSAGIRP